MDILKGLLLWTGYFLLGYIALVIALGILVLLGNIAELWFEVLVP